MKEKSLKQKIEQRFPHVRFSRIVVFQNPNEFTSMYIERINPDHVGILWGKRRKDKHKGTHYIKAGMVYFSIVLVSMELSILGWVDYALGWVLNGLLNIGLLGLCTGFIVSIVFYTIQVRLVEKWKVGSTPLSS